MFLNLNAQELCDFYEVHGNVHQLDVMSRRLNKRDRAFTKGIIDRLRFLPQLSNNPDYQDGYCQTGPSLLPC